VEFTFSRAKKWYGRIALVVSAFIQVGCGGNYQAPVSEQGEQQLTRVPMIVDTSAPDRSYNLSSDPVTTENSFLGGGSAFRTYHVRAGDTLFSIAFEHDLDFRSLAIANNLNPPYTILVGQEISFSSSLAAAVGNNIGEPVGNNSIAQTQGSISRAEGLIRNAISIDSNQLNWRWPHQGGVIRGFEADINKGIDIRGQIGDPVFAASNGDVVYSGRAVQGSGNLIIIRHSDRYLSAYAHNSTMLVGEGARVQAGETIAEVGSNSNGIAMLHFEIRLDGKSVDPTNLLPER